MRLGLKETGEFQTEGESTAAALDSIKTDVFLEIVNLSNKIMNLNMSMSCVCEVQTFYSNYPPLFYHLLI